MTYRGEGAGGRDVVRPPGMTPQEGMAAMGQVVGTAARWGFAWARVGFVAAIITVLLIIAFGSWFWANDGGMTAYQSNISSSVITKGDDGGGNPCKPWGGISSVTALGGGLYSVQCDDASGLGGGVTFQVAR